MPRLRIESGRNAGRSIDVVRPAVIGRGETVELQILDGHASREHCKVFEQAGAWMVADLNSRNGIKVNGVKTTRKNLADGDRIMIGETVVVFEEAGSPSPQAAARTTPAAGAPQASAETSVRKEAAFSAARSASTEARREAERPRPSPAPSKRPAAAAGDGGLKVSDHVLQFNKVDAKSSSPLDFDLAQSPATTRAIVAIVCVLVLAGVIWFVAKLLAS